MSTENPQFERWVPAVLLSLGLLVLGFHLATLYRPVPINDEAMTANYAVFGRYQLQDRLPPSLAPFQNAYAYGLQPIWIGCLRTVFTVLHPGVWQSRLISVIAGVAALIALAFFIWIKERQFWAAALLLLYGWSPYFFRICHSSRPDSVVLALSVLQLAGMWFLMSRTSGSLLGVVAGLSLGIHLNGLYIMPVMIATFLWVQPDRRRWLPYFVWWGVGFIFGGVVVLFNLRGDEAINFLSFASGPYHSLGRPLLFDQRSPLLIRLSNALSSLSYAYPFGGLRFQDYFTAAFLGAAIASLCRWKTLTPFRRFSGVYGFCVLGVFALASPVLMQRDVYYIFGYPWLLIAAMMWALTLKAADARDVACLAAVSSIIFLNQLAIHEWVYVLFCMVLTFRALKASHLPPFWFWVLSGLGVVGLVLLNAIPAFTAYGRYLLAQHTGITCLSLGFALIAAWLVSWNPTPRAWRLSALTAVRCLVGLPLLLAAYDIYAYQRLDRSRYAETMQEVQQVFDQAGRPLLAEPSLWLWRPQTNMQTIWPLWSAISFGSNVRPASVIHSYGNHVSLVERPERLRQLAASINPQLAVVTQRSVKCDAFCLADLDFKNNTP